MDTYVTRQGETVDIACLRHYGRTKAVTETVLDANPGLADLGAVLPFGTVIAMPVSPPPAAPALVKLYE